MNQILLGASIPFAVSVVIYIARRRRAGLVMLVVTPVTMALSALWAVLPDIPRLFGCDELYARLSLDPRCDVFWFHYTIDMHESDSVWIAVGFVTIFILLLSAILRELRIAEAVSGECGGGNR